jgi:Tfp pilus assembly protein PilW
MAMWLKSMSTGRRNAGINIVEVIVTAFIASFFVVALVSLYVYGIQIYKQSVTLI